MSSNRYGGGGRQVGAAAAKRHSGILGVLRAAEIKIDPKGILPAGQLVGSP